MRTYFFCFISLYFCQFLSANNSFGLSNPRKTALAAKTTTAPIIDGIADDPAWLSVLPNSNFTQFKPVHGANPSFRTEVKIMYDDAAIYILAQMYDPHPDSILRQLGLRDEDNLNADMFSIEFDTYNNQLDPYNSPKYVMNPTE